jgi:hypothetical protein
MFFLGDKTQVIRFNTLSSWEINTIFFKILMAYFGKQNMTMIDTNSEMQHRERFRFEDYLWRG